MSEHPGYERGDPAGHGSGNSRNGCPTVVTDAGAGTLAVPRNRNGEFEPRLVPKNARRLAGFNDRILSFYARGMSVRDIRSRLAQIYGVEVSPDLISKVTDAVVDELVTWQNRPRDPVWPIISIDALWVKIRSGSVTSKPVYLAVGVDMGLSCVFLPGGARRRLRRSGPPASRAQLTSGDWSHVTELSLHCRVGRRCRRRSCPVGRGACAVGAPKSVPAFNPGVRRPTTCSDARTASPLVAMPTALCRVSVAPQAAAVLAEAEYLATGHAEIYLGRSRHWAVRWLWFLS
ncbi:transposase [Streptomyces sp. ISL-44]|uniref:transposase n=1 Tax=Streptomyces sp. ISL-44 TaxID=2819184 RepID=UPI0020362009|nr:transposase [Streptomyces sp. ISL-44]